MIINYDILYFSAECIRTDFISIYIKDYNLKIDTVKDKEKSFLQYVKFADIALNPESNMYLYPRTSIQEKYVLLKITKKGLQDANVFIFTSADEVIKPNLIQKNSNIIYYDVICDAQSLIR